MIREKMLNQLSDMADEELTFANATFSQFHSAHEGYGVLMEEVEETLSESGAMECEIESIWYGTKNNNVEMVNVDNLEKCALKCAAEAIQVAAMCRKYRDSLGTNEN